MVGSAARHRLPAAGSVLLLAALLTGCGSSLFATTADSTTAATAATTTTSTTVAATGVGVGIPVTGCGSAAGSAPSGGTGGGGTAGGGTTTVDGWLPTLDVAPIPTALVSQVAFYSDGVHTALAPVGWTCSVVTPDNGGTELVVYPTGDPDPPTSGTPPPGTLGVFAIFDNTGQPHGIGLVCPFFTLPSWQQREALCLSGHVPTGEQTASATPDVATVTDPAGVMGSLPGSGGAHPVTGVVIYPQVMPAVQSGQSLDVVEESCSLTTPLLCPTILSDFEVREFPVPALPPGG